jgi:hypothetical protein
MRPPFYLDQLSSDEQHTVKRLFVRVAGLYSVLALVLVVVVTARINVQAQLTKVAQLATSSAVAAEATSMRQCAARDVSLVIAIEDAGEAQAVPAQAVSDAFLTLLKARDLCSAGSVTEALATYDGVDLTTVRAASK